MSAENPQGERIGGSEPYEISVGVPFKPFKKAKDFIKPKVEEKPFSVPEPYDYILLLQQKVSYLGVEGYIDVISEDIEAMGEVLIGDHSLEKPFDDVGFVLTISESDVKAREIPYILRFSFLLRSPANYVKLLNSFVDINMGEGEYVLVWNINRPCVKENLQHLESGKDVLVIEKNLFNRHEPTAKEEVEEGDLEEFERKVYGRVGFVWLRDDLDKLKTIELVFNQFDDGDNRAFQVEPNPPDAIKAPVPVLSGVS